jgi:RNA-binding protein
MSTPGSRMLIIQCEAAQLPGLYTEITDRNMQPVGTIVDIFGNIKKPYATVVCKERCAVRQNDKLYAKAGTGSKEYRTVDGKQ